MGVHAKHHESAGISVHDKLVYTISDLAGMGIMSRTQAYIEHKAGRLEFKKMGKRTLILREDLLAWLRGLPCKMGAMRK